MTHLHSTPVFSMKISSSEGLDRSKGRKTGVRRRRETGVRGRRETGVRRGGTGVRGRRETGVRGRRETGVRGRETGVRGRETGVRGRETGVRGRRETGVRGRREKRVRGRRHHYSTAVVVQRRQGAMVDMVITMHTHTYTHTHTDTHRHTDTQSSHSLTLCPDKVSFEGQESLWDARRPSRVTSSWDSGFSVCWLRASSCTRWLTSSAHPQVLHCDS